MQQRSTPKKKPLDEYSQLTQIGTIWSDDCASLCKIQYFTNVVVNAGIERDKNLLRCMRKYLCKSGCNSNSIIL